MEIKQINKIERNYGVDLFKIVSMYMVVIQHIILHGTDLIHDRSIGNLSNLLYVIVYCSVNCFALASGYIMVSLEYKFHRLILHWMQVVFYLLIFNIVYSIITDGNLLSVPWLEVFTPISSNNYWYFTSYAILFLFMPFYNYLINHIGIRMNLILAGLLLTVFSVFSFLSSDIFFNTNYGFSFWWLSIMYLIGGITKKHIEKIIRKKFALIAFALCVMMTASGLLLKALIAKTQIPLLIRLSDNFFSLGYNKLTVALSALFLLIIFARIRINSKLVSNITKTCSGLTFGVYIIHDNKIIREALFKNHFSWIDNIHPAFTVVTVLAIALIVFVTCMLIDYFRCWVFRLAKIDYACKLIADYFVGKIKIIIQKLY